MVPNRPLLPALLVAAALVAPGCATDRPTRVLAEHGALRVAPVTPSSAAQDAPTADGTTREGNGQVAFLLGAADFDGDWGPLDDTTLFGVEFVSPPQLEGLAIEAGLLFGDEDDRVAGVKVDVERLIGYAGVRKTFEHDRLRPYLGGGLEASHADARVRAGGSSASDDDLAFGLYVRAGVEVPIDERAFVALDARLGGFLTEHDFGGADLDSDYSQIAAMLGFRF